MPSPGCRMRSLAILAVAAIFACALPSRAAAEPPHEAHFGGRFGGGHFEGHPATRGFAVGRGGGEVRGHAHWNGGPGDAPHWHAGSAPARRWEGDHWRSGDWNGDRWHRGDGDWGDHWRGDDWRRPDWTGRVWVGGDWDGRYWPRVDYDWDYPWYLPVMPYGAVTLWFGDVPYYYVNQVYYTWNPYYSGYVVADPPPVEASPGAVPPPGDASASGPSSVGVLSLHVTPLKGQSPQQTENDRYACHQWAVAQSGFDPINASQDAHATSGMRDSYRRALTACLSARGYSVQAPR